jgi:hypothetical protein
MTEFIERSLRRCGGVSAGHGSIPSDELAATRELRPNRNV